MVIFLNFLLHENMIRCRFLYEFVHDHTDITRLQSGKASDIFSLTK